METGDNLKRIFSANLLQKILGIFINHSAPVCLFIMLPFTVALYLGYHAITLEKANHISEISSHLETGLTQLACAADSEVFLKKIAKGAWRKVGATNSDENAVSSYYKSLQRFLQLEFDLYLFDRHGKLTTPSQFQLRSRFVATRLWEILACSPSEQNRKFQLLKKPLKSFLGNEFRMAQFLEGRDSTVQIITRHKQGLLYWINDPEMPSRGMLMIFWETPDLEFRLKQAMLRMKKLFSSGFIVGDEKLLFTSGLETTLSETLLSTYRKIALLGQSSVIDAGEKIWAGRRVADMWVIVAGQSLIQDYYFLQIKFVGGLLLLFFGFLFFYVYVIGRGKVYFSIRWKLTALFMVAVMTPIMGFVYFGYRYLDDRTRTLAAEVTSHSRQLLLALDESFKHAGASYVDEFFSLSRLVASGSESFVRKMIENKIEKHELINLELRDTDNAELLFFLQNDLFFEGMREVNDAFSRYCIDNTMGSKLADTIDPLMSMAVKSPEAGMFFLFTRPGEVHRVEFGPVHLYIFWDIFKSASDKSVYVYIVQSAARLLGELIRRHLATSFFSRTNSPYILAANHLRSGEWLPAPLRHVDGLKGFTDLTSFSDKPTETRLRFSGEEYIVTGQKGKYAKGHSLYAFYPAGLIEKEIAGQRRLIFAGIILFILLALLAGWLLSDIFLRPVAELGKGVNAIKNRNSAFRIEATQQDEFGDLALSFNQMIADLKEMELARDVQESLLPSAPPVIDGYEVSFANRMASAVGGDYFDIHLLDKDRVCVVIGDVTGHGVSSALVMAMARAILYQGLKENRDLITLFSDLNQAVYTYFSAQSVKKMITLFATILDLSTGQAVFTNAGHNFPLKLSLDGSCQELNSVHLPIGAMKKLKKLKTSNFAINPGESLVFYTDGLIEAKNAQAQLYGYERLKQLLSANIGFTADGFVAELMKSYDAWLAGSAPDDDITLIVLRRL